MTNGTESRKRRPKGDGSIVDHPTRPDLKLGYVDLGRDPVTGSRVRRKVTGRTEAEVARKMRDLRREEEGGVDVRRQAPTVEAVALDWLDRAAPKTKATSTLDHTRLVVHRHLIPALGRYRVDALRPEDVEAWLEGEASTGKAKATLVKYRADLRQILGWAMRRRLVTWNVAVVAELPVDARPSAARRSLTPTEAEKLLDVLDGDRFGPYFTTMLLLGLRPGEVDALPWNAVDVDRGTVRIGQALQRRSGGAPHGIGPTKAKRDRVLALPPRLVDALRVQRVRQAEDRLAAGPGWSADERWTGLVFVSELGTPFFPSNLRRYFAALCDRAEIGRFTPYELRHSAASLLVAAGVAPHEVADFLGHADERMLHQHYRHRIEPVVTAGVAVMERLGKPASN